MAGTKAISLLFLSQVGLVSTIIVFSHLFSTCDVVVPLGGSVEPL